VSRADPVDRLVASVQAFQSLREGPLGHIPLEQAPKETPRRSGASQGYREERYMYVSM
jgi:hypothetical protein